MADPGPFFPCRRIPFYPFPALVLAWPLGSSGCKHTKSSITFSAWLGLDYQTNKHILAGEQ